MQHSTEIDPAMAARYGNRFLVDEVPSMALPDEGMPAPEAMRLIAEDLTLEGNPQRNLATFVTTWMEPEAQRIIAENLHRNFIDHAEYPRTAEIEQRCIRMLAGLFHAPGKTAGARTQGSSEAIMLGALSLKWNWRKRREAAGKPVDRPNLVFGGDVHVVWEKFCRYFDVEPRIVPLQEHRYTIGPDGRGAARGREHDRRGGRAGHDVHRAVGRHRRNQRRCLPVSRAGTACTFRCTWMQRAAASSGPSCTRTPSGTSGSAMCTRSTCRGTSSAWCIPGIGWLIFREPEDLNEDLVFYENYLGKTDATFTLNFSTGSAMVLAQYYNLIRLGREGYKYVMEMMQQNARVLADHLVGSGDFELIGQDEEQLPLVAFRLAEPRSYNEFDIAWQLSAERGWMVPAYTLPPNAQHVTLMRALVKETLSREMVDTLAADIARACQTLDDKGGVHESERQQVKTATGY